ncbi:hypothetical protein EDI_309320 [Entamoeba dispar SAW760]|uniref:Transmembrane protein n=1 Tax=Entamoeba dispar (strain ATCC PRA-260 / SAW760) TaxID=370354 RepID=B0EIT6_ENTDS|nr:uncharacterized protein EDI_309320 [Entamoeba dispar SAW760]EDR25560.1 hypothetical protein EDI_309320 [Entamoeba dispar SAW760]|eukprot:EDR25560.1 hypothetical protein EDI_309320 [Entamoeba dispar SAW760]
MKDILYIYEKDNPTIEDEIYENKTSLNNYFKNQYKVKVLIKLVLIISIITSIMFGIIRVITLRRSYTCNSRYSTFFIETIPPPNIEITNNTQFYTFIDPTFKIEFNGTFIEKDNSRFFGGKIIYPEVTLNDSRFSLKAQFDRCDYQIFYKHYIICHTLRLRFYLNSININTIKPYPITISIKDPDPSYSMYFTDSFDCGCKSNFTMVLIPLNNQTTFYVKTKPTVICDNSSNINEQQKFINLTLQTFKSENKFYPFIQQYLTIINQTKIFNPVIIETEIDNNNLTHILSKELNIISTQLFGDSQIFEIIVGQNGTIGYITFYNKVTYQCYLQRNKFFHFIAIPFVFDKIKNKIPSAFVASGIYNNHFDNINITILKSNLYKTTFSIRGSFIFYHELLPQIFINDKNTSIVNIIEPSILNFNQFLNYETGLVKCKEFIVEIRGYYDLNKIKKINIIIPECSNCQLIKYF